jgi:hypothetical protein
VNTCLAIAPGEHLLFARNGNYSDNGGLVEDFDYNNVVFANNGGDDLSISNSADVIDEVTWTKSIRLALGAGNAGALHPNNQDATENDISTVWCAAASAYGSGDNGTPGAINDSCGESIDTLVQPIFNSDCTSCHSGSSPSKGLDLASGNAWDSLYLVSSTQSGSDDLVAPGDAANSWLFIKVEGTQGSGNGVQMPDGSSALSSSDQNKIEDWINDGAWK